MTREFLTAVQEAAAAEYEVYGELGRAAGGYLVYLARERSGRAQLVLLELRPVGQDADGAEQYNLGVVAEVQTPGSVAGKVCPSCGATDPRSGRFCARCGSPIAAADGGAPARSRKELLEALRRDAAGAYEILGEMEQTAGRGVVYFARERESGGLVALRLQQESGAAAGDDEYSLDVTQDLGPLLASLGPAGAVASPLGRRTMATRVSVAPSVPSQETGIRPIVSPHPRRRPASHRTWAAAALVLVLVGGAVFFAFAAKRRSVVVSTVAPQTVELPADTASAPATGAEMPPAPRADSGSLRVTGLPEGAAVSVDGLQLDSMAARVPVGRHEVSIEAPGFERRIDSIDIAANATADLSPPLVKKARRARAPVEATETPTSCAYPGPEYNSNNECLDELPKLIDGSYRVLVPPDLAGTPRPSTLWVKVSATGRTETVEPYKRSSPEFEALAMQRADSLRWTPALKNGKAVSSWLEVQMVPVRR